MDAVAADGPSEQRQETLEDLQACRDDLKHLHLQKAEDRRFPPPGNQPNISQASFKEWGEEREEEEPERRRQLDRRDSWREWWAGRVQMFDL